MSDFERIQAEQLPPVLPYERRPPIAPGPAPYSTRGTMAAGAVCTIAGFLLTYSMTGLLVLDLVARPREPLNPLSQLMCLPGPALLFVGVHALWMNVRWLRGQRTYSLWRTTGRMVRWVLNLV